MSAEPVTLREAIDTASTLLGREMSPGEVRMIEMSVKSGLTIEDLIKMFGMDDAPEPEPPGTYHYEATTQGAQKVPDAEGNSGGRQ